MMRGEGAKTSRSVSSRLSRQMLRRHSARCRCRVAAEYQADASCTRPITTDISAYVAEHSEQEIGDLFSAVDQTDARGTCRDTLFDGVRVHLLPTEDRFPVEDLK